MRKKENTKWMSNIFCLQVNISTQQPNQALFKTPIISSVISNPLKHSGGPNRIHKQADPTCRLNFDELHPLQVHTDERCSEQKT